MPQWAGSSWYFLRYIDNKNNEELVSREKADKYLPVDMYIGGVEKAMLDDCICYIRSDSTRCGYSCHVTSAGVIDFDEDIIPQTVQPGGMITE